jgi:UPF0755 protein
MAKRGKSGITFLRGLFLLAAFALPILVVGYILTAKSDPKPDAFSRLEADRQTGTILYEVPKKVALAALAQDLEEKGLIRNATVFRAFLRLTGQDKKIRAGFYAVKPSNSVLEMASKLTAGKQATRMVTIPEGKTAWEIFGILKAHFAIDSVVFDSLAYSPEFARLCRVDAPSLEGYLFPDTYVLPWKMNEREVLKVMVRRFHDVVASFDLESPVVRKYGLHGWVTLASIVEEESAIPTEQELIAGVFYNRLVQGWSLGADPTVRYALRKLTGPLYVSELNNDSPYNTRKFTGLPPGPISSPGQGALKASLNPIKTDMMYFVAKDDGSREHFFSVDNSQHVRYKDTAAANRMKRSREQAKAARSLTGQSPAGNAKQPDKTQVAPAARKKG